MRDPVPSPLPATLRSLLPCIALAAMWASAPAAGQAYATRDVGGWTVAASSDGGGCFVTRTYAVTGGTTLLFGLDTDGANRLSVLNDNWSIKPKDRWKLTFKLTSGGYPDHPVVGMASDTQRGFVTDFDAKFPAHFAASKALHIYRGKVPVEQLVLDGSGAAVAELRNCVGIQAAKPRAVPETGRSDRIPKDPFAPEPKRKSDD